MAAQGRGPAGSERLRLGLLVAAAVLVGATAWRADRLVGAAVPEGATVRTVGIDRTGGLQVASDGAGWRVRWGGRDRVLGDGDSTAHRGVTARVERRAAGAWRSLVRTPWSVYGGPRGFTRLDFGPDAVGKADGVRDRVVLPRAGSDGGWFRLVPLAGERFGADDRGARVVAERPGLSLDGVALAVGAPKPVGERFEIAGAGYRIVVRWADGATARPVIKGGRIVAWTEAVEPLWTVSAWEPSDDVPEPWVVVERGDERADVRLGDGWTVVHGPGDRIGIGGTVLPEAVADEALGGLVERGLAEGWIELGTDRAFVAAPPEVPRRMRRRLRRLLARYDRARAPLALRVLQGPADGVGVEVDGQPVPARFDRDLQAWLPSDRGAGAEAVFLAPAERIEAALPVDARGADGRWRPLLSDPHGWTAAEVPSGTTGLRVRRPAHTLGDAVSAAVAGAPDGTFLVADAVRFGGRAFDGWDAATPAARRVAAEAWTAVPGDRWRADGPGPEAGREARSVYLRVPVTAKRGGGLALDLTLPADATSARWNGVPIDAPAAGAQRLSLKLRPGENLLAVELRLPGRVAPAVAGGVRFSVDAAGRATALDPSVAQLRRRAAVRNATSSSPEPSRRLVVEHGGGLLPDGWTWRVDDASRLWTPPEGGLVAERETGRLELRDGLPTWVNGQRGLAVTRRVDTDPDGPPLAGYRVAPGRLQPLVDPGDAVAAEPRIRRAMTPAGEVAGPLIVAGADPIPLELDDAVPGAFDLAVRRRGADLSVAPDRAARMLLPDGTFAAVAAEAWHDWPPGARLLIADPPMTLLRPAVDPARPAWLPEGPTTVDPAAQALAEAALDDAIARSNVESDDPASLLGALVLLDADSGDVLACAARHRRGTPEGWLPCAADPDYAPGSTFKVAVAAAALGSTDPTVRRMLDGQLPTGLGRELRRSLDGAKLPALPTSRPARRLRSKLSNHRGGAMAPDTDLAAATKRSLNTWYGYLGLLLHRPVRQGWADAAVVSQAAREEAWPVLAWARQAGFGATDRLGGLLATGGVLPGSAAPSDAVVAARSVGQGDVRATPLGVARLLAGAVTGAIPAPRLDPEAPVEQALVLDEAGVRRLRAALGAVVLDGTAKRAFADNPDRDRIVGKTGSAERVDARGLSRTDAWFAGALLPGPGSTEPPIVAVALLPDGGLGGRAAAEAVDQALQGLVRARARDRKVALR